ncbi:MAG TPA: hypothetical protein DCE78_06855 [Bacteroidetes bacterium]|nr:hypothetical protein [Bacteroidota bacterium]
MPKYRGAAPIHWAVIRGESETGVTIFFLDEQVDTGKYLLQDRIKIGPDDTTGDVYDRLMKIGANSMVHGVEMIASGKYSLIEQDHAMSTSAPKIFPEQAKIDLNKSSLEVVNHIRGVNPFPTAWMLLDGKKMKVHRARVLEVNQIEDFADLDGKYDNNKGGRINRMHLIDETESTQNMNDTYGFSAHYHLRRNELATLLNVDGKLVAKCADGLVEFTEVQLEGKRLTSGEDFLRGYQGDLVIS